MIDRHICSLFFAFAVVVDFVSIMFAKQYYFAKCVIRYRCKADYFASVMVLWIMFPVGFALFALKWLLSNCGELCPPGAFRPRRLARRRRPGL